MRKILKKTLSVLIAVIMVLSAAPLSNLDLFSTKAEAKEYAVGDIIEFGSYPQSEVKDSETLSSLNSLSLNWLSYGYYIGSYGNIGSMIQSDYMKYSDVTFEGNKYRAVSFTKYRPYLTCYSSSSDNSRQDENGYYTNTTYWFRYEPIYWRVLDPNEGLVMCESIIDAQPYSNTIYQFGVDPRNYDAYWNDSLHTHYANDYATSSIREWLNDDFYNTAFTSTQQSKIKSTTLDNSAYSSNYSVYDSETTLDKIFLLSYDEVLNTQYGFDSSFSSYDTARRAKGSDYAKCQGLDVGSSLYGDSNWYLRSPSSVSMHACYIENLGTIFGGTIISHTDYGVRPAMNISDFPSKHVCDFSTFEYYQTIHPHYAVYKCGCGAEKVTDETTTVENCEICNPPHTHSWSEWYVTFEPTNEADGREERVCSACGATEEKAIPKLAETVKDEESGIEVIIPNGSYDEEIELEIEEQFDGTSFQIVNGLDNVTQAVIYDITTKVNGETVQPSQALTIKIPLPEGFDPNYTSVYHINSETGMTEKMNSRYENGYLIFETTHFSYYSIVEQKETTLVSISITSQPSVNRYKYGVENLDTSGLEITAKYSDGSTKVIDNAEVEFTGFDTSERGFKTITANYEGLTATFDIEVYFTFGQWLLYIICFGWIWM